MPLLAGIGTVAAIARSARAVLQVRWQLQRQTEAEISPEMVRAHGLSEDEYRQILGILGRTPTLVELSMAVGALHSEGEILEKLLQQAVGTLDARVGVVATRTADGGDRAEDRSRLPQPVPTVPLWS